MKGIRKAITASAIGLLGAAIVLAVAAPAQASPTDRAQPRAPRPDLVPTAGRLTGDPYMFLGNRYPGSWRGTIKNKGTASAGSTLTVVYLAPGRLSANVRARDTLADDVTGRIDAGKNERVNAGALPPEADLKPGAYSVYVCADAKKQVEERNEDNNCRFVGERGKRFYVAFERWTGSLRGAGPMIWGGGAREDWSSSNVAFTFRGYTDPGYFGYGYGGPVTYVASGTTAGGCTVSGGGTVFAGTGSLSLDYEGETYSALGFGTGSDYDYLLDCGGTVSPYPGAENYVFISTDPVPGVPQPLPFGARSVSNGFTDEFGVNYTWDLSGDDG